MLKYCRKTENFTQNDFDSMSRETWIEIVPIYKKNFDVISLIDFLDAISPNFVFIKFKSRDGKINITIRHEKLNENQVSFKVKICNSFYDIQIFVKDGIHIMRKDEINTIKCICFDPFSLKEKQISFYEKNTIWDDHFPFKNSPLYRLGKFIANNNTKAPLFLKYAFRGFLNKKTLQRRKQILPIEDDFYHLIQNLPGYVYLVYSDISINPHFSLNLKKNIKKGFVFKVDQKYKVIKSFIWIAPWAQSIIDKINYLELDGSFKATRPYTYCIFHGVHFNSSIPFAVSLHFTESSELYELLFVGLRKFHLKTEPFENKQILSDMGDSIISFSKKHFMTNNFCHRHLIEHFGPKSGLGLIVIKILETRTLLEYMKIREELLGEIEEFEKIQLKSPSCDQIQIEKIYQIKIMLALPEDIENGKFDFDIIDSNYFYPKWANWERREYNIPRCSNHSEGFHGNINNTIPKKGIYSMKTGFTKIIDFLMNYLENRKNNFGDSFRKRHIKIIEKVRTILREGPDSYLKCSCENCDCEEILYNRAIYGVDFPCEHTVLHDFITGEFFQKFISEYHINLSEFFISCTKYFPFSFYPIDIFDQKIEGIISKISSNFISKYLEIKNEDLLKELARQFLQCFSYSLPEFIDIDLHQSSINHFENDEDNKKFEFPRQEPHTEFINIEEKEIDFWLSASDSECAIMIKKNIMKLKMKYVHYIQI